MSSSADTATPPSKSPAPTALEQPSSPRPWDKTKVLGRIELEIDLLTRRVKSAKGSLVPVLAEKTDEATKAILDKYAPEIEKQMGVTVGEALADLGRTSNRCSSTLGNFLTDAMLRVSGADLALQNQPGIRADIPKGPITRRSLYNVSPFGNTIVTLEITGRQLRELMEDRLGRDFGFLEMAGMTCRCDSRKPIGSRVLEITVGGKPLDPERIYKIATNNYLAEGGDDITIFKSATNKTYLQIMLRQATERTVRELKTIKPDPSLRLEDLAVSAHYEKK
jgi:5'-nucleotidase/UDP-sugar diphosphatase